MSESVVHNVGVVVVNYNAGQHLLRCIASVINKASEIIVVDNESEDSSLKSVADNFPQVRIVKMGRNAGYGAAMNRGVNELSVDIDQLFLINPDTIIGDDAVDVLQKRLTDDLTLVAVGPKITEENGESYPSARRFPSIVDGIGHGLFGLIKPSNKWSQRYKLTSNSANAISDVQWISGAAMYIRRSAFEEVNGFDESYFMYLEDVDLCWRLANKGGKIAYEPSAQVAHVGQVSSNRRPYRMIWEHHKSLIRYNARTIQGPQKLFLPFITVGLLVRVPIAGLAKFRALKKMG